jgi:hypothetical protein
MMNSTAFFLDSSGLFLLMMMVLALSVVVVSVLLQHVELLELVPGNHLVSLVLGSLEGGEGGASGFLAFHVMYLSLSSLNIYLHADLLRFGVVFLDVLEGGEGGVSSVLLLHVKLLSPVPDNDTLANLLGVLFLRMGTQVVAVCVYSAFCFVLMASSTWSFSSISTSTLFLIMLAQVLIVGMYSAFCFVLSAFNYTLANLLGILFSTQVWVDSVYSAFCFVSAASSPWLSLAISSSTLSRLKLDISLFLLLISLQSA